MSHDTRTLRTASLILGLDLARSGPAATRVDVAPVGDR